MPNIYAHTGDAYMRVDDEATWAGARDATVAEIISTTAVKYNSSVKAAANLGGNQYDCYRYFAAFDTSGITVKPESATLKLYGFTYTDAQIIVIKVNSGATGNSSTDYVAADFSQTSSTAYSLEVTSWTDEAYNEITLNDTALTDMASLSEFKIAVIDHDYDFNNQTPPNSFTRRTGWYHADEVADPSKDPLISYVAGSEPASDFTHSQVEASSLVGDDYTINSFKSGSLGSQYERNSDQVPFSLGVRGPRHLRGRTTSYSVTLGDKNKK